jgi:hypothetical protein
VLSEHHTLEKKTQCYKPKKRVIANQTAACWDEKHPNSIQELVLMSGKAQVHGRKVQLNARNKVSGMNKLVVAEIN